MAGGANTAALLGGVGALTKSIPPEYQSTFGTAAQLAGLSQPAAPSSGPVVNNSSAPGPSPVAASSGILSKLADFARSPAGMITGAVAVALLAFKFYKGRAK
jgi:hypothetical protein